MALAYTLIFHLVPVAFRTTSPTRFAEQEKQVERAKTFTMWSCENGKTILENSISATHYAASNHRSFCLFRQKRSLLLFHLQTSESLFAVLSFIARMDFFCSSPPHTDAFSDAMLQQSPIVLFGLFGMLLFFYEFKRSDIYTTAHIEFDSHLLERIVKGLQYDSRMNHPV